MKQLYYNGTIITVNDLQPTAEALLVEDGKIVAVGTLAGMKGSQDETTELIDLDGKRCCPVLLMVMGISVIQWRDCLNCIRHQMVLLTVKKN